MSGSLARAAVCLIAWLPALAAQDVPIRAQTELVQVPVSVKAKDGRSVEGLAARDFRVLDDGIEREITADVFDSGAAGISLVIAIQTSAVPASAFPEIHRIGGMIQPLVIGRRGEAAVLAFDDEIEWPQDFTRDSREIQRAVRDLKPGSPLAAHLLDAVVEAAHRLRDRKGRKVLLLVAASRDEGSSARLDDAVEAVEREGIEVFGAHYSPKPQASGPRPKEPDAIHLLSESTGGWDYPYRKERGLEKAIEELGVEIHSQYILSFPQRTDLDGRRPITVTVPGRPDLSIRARWAYWTSALP